jgi:hypothetical protein
MCLKIVEELLVQSNNYKTAFSRVLIVIVMRNTTRHPWKTNAFTHNLELIRLPTYTSNTKSEVTAVKLHIWEKMIPYFFSNPIWYGTYV